ncbi:MAG: glycosyltransferase [Anaerolineae bacterium]|nr:glycosyltransferase [Anaerolineae bacterium]
MATYNGAQYLPAQLSSILSQLGADDELVIVDDASTDKTVSVIRSYGDARLNLVCNPSNQGVVKTFERAIALATGDVILLSDQDDFWLDGKVAMLQALFASDEVDLVVHNAIVIQGNVASNRSLFEMRDSGPGVIKNVISNTYVGCCMAFRSCIRKHTLPIASHRGVVHDGWIGILAELYGYRIRFIDTPLILHVRHGGNTTTLKRRNLAVVVRDRVNFVASLVWHVVCARSDATQSSSFDCTT